MLGTERRGRAEPHLGSGVPRGLRSEARPGARAPEATQRRSAGGLVRVLSCQRSEAWEGWRGPSEPCSAQAQAGGARGRGHVRHRTRSGLADRRLSGDLPGAAAGGAGGRELVRPVAQESAAAKLWRADSLTRSEGESVRCPAAYPLGGVQQKASNADDCRCWGLETEPRALNMLRCALYR